VRDGDEVARAHVGPGLKDASGDLHVLLFAFLVGGVSGGQVQVLLGEGAGEIRIGLVYGHQPGEEAPEPF